MKITFIINSLSYKAGTERVACNLANLFFEKLGYHVDILNRDTSFDEVAYRLNSNIGVYALNGNYMSFYFKVQDYINKNKPDYLIVHNMGRLSLLCSFLKKNDTKIISFEHGAFDNRPSWVKFFSKLVYRSIDTIITLTKQDELNYKDWNKNVVSIFNVSPFSVTAISSLRDKDIISVGRLTYQKNFQALLQAWTMIQSQIGDWRLKIYGEGECFSELVNIIKKNGLQNVQLMGQTSNIEQIYDRSSLFVMSSLSEGLPMVLIEAQTFGLPIISFDCPHGPAEVIYHQKNGLLVENQNVKALAEAMLSLMQNDEKREQYSQQAFVDAQRFQENSILQKWKNILEI